MYLLATPIIAAVALITSVLCLAITFGSFARHKAKMAVYESQYQAQELLVNNLQMSNEDLNLALSNLSVQHDKSITENTLISKQLEHRIKALQSQLHSQQELISQLQTDQGEDKFYSRAIKLAQFNRDLNGLDYQFIKRKIRHDFSL